MLGENIFNKKGGGRETYPQKNIYLGEEGEGTGIAVYIAIYIYFTFRL